MEGRTIAATTAATPSSGARAGTNLLALIADGESSSCGWARGGPPHPQGSSANDRRSWNFCPDAGLDNRARPHAKAVDISANDFMDLHLFLK
jgi:hypothetical protein